MPPSHKQHVSKRSSSHALASDPLRFRAVLADLCRSYEALTIEDEATVKTVYLLRAQLERLRAAFVATITQPRYALSFIQAGRLVHVRPLFLLQPPASFNLLSDAPREHVPRSRGRHVVRHAHGEHCAPFSWRCLFPHIFSAYAGPTGTTRARRSMQCVMLGGVRVARVCSHCITPDHLTSRVYPLARCPIASSCAHTQIQDHADDWGWGVVVSSPRRLKSAITVPASRRRLPLPPDLEAAVMPAGRACPPLSLFFSPASRPDLLRLACVC